MKHTLLQSVQHHNMHLAPHGKKDKSFAKVMEIIVSNIPHFAFTQMQKSSVKTVRDKFLSMIRERRNKAR